MRNKNIIIAYLIVSFIFITVGILSLEKYSYSGYYTDKIINWIWLAMTFFIIIWFWRKKMIKVYFWLLVSGLILSILPMMIPLFGIVHYFSTIGCHQRIGLDKIYRIERGRPNVLYNPQITVYRKEGILEKQISRVPYSHITDHVLRSNVELPIDESKQPIQQAKLIKVTKDSIGIEYQIMNKKNIFYHKVKESRFD